LILDKGIWKKENKIMKRNFKIIFLLIVIGVFIFLNYNQVIANNFPRNQGKDILFFNPSKIKGNRKIDSPPSVAEKIKEKKEEPKFNGYIVQFWGDVPESASTFEWKREILKNTFYLTDAQMKRKFKNVFSGVSIENVPEEKIKEIEKLPIVKRVYPNYQVKAFLNETIPLIHATSSWALGYTGKNVAIAIIDTGVDYTHPMLGGCDRVHIGCKVANGYDFVNNDNDPMDDNGHGTHCAGIAAGKLDLDNDNVYEPENGEIWGVAPDATLFAYKVLDAYGSGWISDVIAGIEAAVEDHADVISMSLGGFGNPDDPLSQAADNAVAQGVVVVVAAGNEGPAYETVSSPGTARKVITVGASNKSDQIADFSSRGPVKWSGKVLIKPDVLAPGVAVTSSVPTGTCELCDSSGYKSLSGTSMATPHVAGLAALLKQAHPDWAPEVIKMVIRNTAKDLGYDIFTQGYGRIDVEAAINVTTSPPIARLKEFSYEATGTIQIYGTATNTTGTLESYALYYGEAPKPTNWNLICTSSNPVVEGILCSFDTSRVKDGEYLIKLEAKDSFGRVSVDTNLIYVNNIEITFPLNNDIFRAGDRIEIRGRAIIGTSGSQSYSLEYGLGATPTSWTTITSSTNQVIDGILGIWDTSQITQPDFYTIRITANYSSGVSSSEYIRNIYLDPTLKEGWPRRLKELNYWGGLVEPVVGDLEGDGKKEIIVYQGGPPPKLYVFKEDGSILKGWPVELENEYLTGFDIAAPSIADVDGDGEKEILVNGLEKVYIYGKDGTLKKEISVDGWVLSSPVVVDLNNDRKPEIIVRFEGETGQFLAVFDSEGNLRSGWPKLYYDYQGQLGCVTITPYESVPAVGNFDDDPELEIVVAGNRNTPSGDCEGRVHVFNFDGSIVKGFPVDLEGKVYSSPSVGDVDRDGNNEIVVGTLKGNVYVIKNDGKILNGWPKSIRGGIWGSPALADFDGDGYLEIGLSSYGAVSVIYLFDYQGNIISGWPKITSHYDVRSPLFVDINGDGKLDVLGNGGGIENNSGIYAWDFQGNLIEGFPKITENYAEAAATLADIDMDEKLELVASSDHDEDLTTGKLKYRNTIYVWELNQDYNREKIKWPMFHHDPQHSGLYGFTALFTEVLGVGGDTEAPFLTDNPAPWISIGGEYGMKCRWGLEDLPYSKLPQDNEMICGFGSLYNCRVKLPNMGEEGEKRVYVSCQDEFGNEQTKYQNLDVVFTYKILKAAPGGFYLPPSLPKPWPSPPIEPWPPSPEKKAEEEEIKKLLEKISQLKSSISQYQSLLQQILAQRSKQILSEIPPDFKFEKPIRYGDKGNEVRYLQVLLKALGFYKGPINGINDLSTLLAIRKFQLTYGLIDPQAPKSIAGYVGPATRAKLNEILESLRKSNP
jgi:subtilisin family serine protease